MGKYHPLADCDNCPLALTGTYLGTRAPSHSNYDVAMVGGMPNQSEQFRGGFLNTKAGELVRKVFKHHGENPKIYYTTAVACRPPENAKINPKAVACCRPRVLHEIEQATAGPVVTLGNEGALSVLGRQGVTSLRVGPAKQSEWISNPIIPTVSPYLCFSQEARFPDLVTDFGKAYQIPIKFEEPEYTVIDTSVGAIRYLRGLLEDLPDEITIDIECVLDKETSFGHPERHEMLCVGMQADDHSLAVITANALTDKVWLLLEELLKKVRIIAQNGKFDLNGIRPYVGKIKLAFDTMLASYALDERGGIHGLKYMAQEYLGAPAYDDEIKKYIGPSRDFSKIPLDILYKYNAFDVYCTYLLSKLLGARLAEQGLTHVHDMLVAASNTPLSDIEWNGIGVDVEYLNKLSEEFYWSLLRKEHELSVMAYSVRPEGYLKGDGINPNSPMQIKRFLSDCGVQVDSTDEEHLQAILDYQGRFPPKYESVIKKFVAELMLYRKEKKLDGTYVTGVKDRLHNGKIHSSYLLHGTTTGRLSSRNPNLQNIPRKSPIKTMYVPSRPGYVMINTDYSQAELRTLSYFAKDIYFRDIFNDGTRDPFDELVPVLFNGAKKATSNPDVWKEQRTMVKTYVYGLSYGRTEYGIARGFGIPVEVARKHMQSFFSVIPEIVSWQKEVQQKVLDGEDLITPYGRHRRYTLITEENKQNVMNEALAFLPQSTASDMCLTAAIDLGARLDANYPEVRIINLVHDAIMTEAPKELADEIILLTESCMLESAKVVVGDYVKFGVASSIGMNWGELS